MKLLDWAYEPASGVVVLRDGTMRGGGPFAYYTGSYSIKENHVKGELVVNLHTPYPPGDLHFFHGRDIGIGVSGTCDDDNADLFGTVLVGTRSVGLHATLRRLADA